MKLNFLTFRIELSPRRNTVLHGVWRLFCEISYCGRRKKNILKVLGTVLQTKQLFLNNFHCTCTYVLYAERKYSSFFWTQILNPTKLNLCQSEERYNLYSEKIEFSNELLSCAYKKQGDFFLNSIQQPTQAAIHEIAYDCLVPLRQEYSRKIEKIVQNIGLSQL